MSDLKIRLLEMSNCEANETAEIMVKAAERIEHLERVLAQARKALDSGSWDYGPDQDEHKECDKAIAAIDEALNSEVVRPLGSELTQS